MSPEAMSVKQRGWPLGAAPRVSEALITLDLTIFVGFGFFTPNWCSLFAPKQYTSPSLVKQVKWSEPYASFATGGNSLNKLRSKCPSAFQPTLNSKPTITSSRYVANRQQSVGSVSL